MRGTRAWLDLADAALLAEGEEVTLMDWGNAIIKSITRDAAGAVTGLAGSLNLEGDVKKTKYKLTWLAATDELLALTLVDFDFLINKKKVEEDDNFQDLVNPTTRFEKAAIGEAAAQRTALNACMHGPWHGTVWPARCLRAGLMAWLAAGSGGLMIVTHIIYLHP